ncbi:lasso peptide biosynthesis PqqD family chaperone [Robertmurraya sp. P23]|uniref:lasso peptide biosynthesis PqqD family chaperone n=1 Tax=Robertmurraya sp. P23 TaxID=3436931 RepID=UPI003D95907A
MLKQKEIMLTDYVKQVEGNIVSDMGGEKVMLSIENGKYYNLGESGGAIWGLIESDVKVKEVITRLTELYEVEQKECEEQVVAFLNHLLNEGLVKIV